jgi:tetratricopeptide (TPR) repeat protein
VDAAGLRLARRAVAHLRSSGQRAFDRDDARAAAKLLTQAVGLLPDDDPERLALIPALGEALFMAAEYQRAAELLTAEIERHTTTADQQTITRIRLALLNVRWLIEPVGWVDEARRGAERAIAVLEPAGDAPGLASAWRLLALVHRGEGRCAEAELACEQILRHARQAGNGRMAAWSMAESAINLLWGPAPVAKGLACCSTMLAELADRPLSSALVFDHLAGLQVMAGDFATAEQTLARADALADLATVLDVAGHSQQAVPVVREAIGQYRRKGNRTSAARARKTSRHGGGANDWTAPVRSGIAQRPRRGSPIEGGLRQAASPARWAGARAWSRLISTWRAVASDGPPVAGDGARAEARRQGQER